MRVQGRKQRALRQMAGGLLLAAAACAPAHPPAAVAPVAGDGRAADSIALASRTDSGLGALMGVPGLESSPEDSAADLAALEALAALEFGNFGRTGPVRGANPADAAVSTGDVTDETARLFGSRGGTASATGPTYDIDVESFANHARVQYYVDFFLGEARDRFAIWLTRLPRYEGMIRERLRQYGVPEDMVYLALIESGYSNTAVSWAHAVGMWQFIAGTGRRYGLMQDVWLDERRDPFKATDAAARHLADLNGAFGSWYLAAAAYNAGPGRVTRGLRRLRTGAEGASDSTFFALSDKRYLRRETRDYVPKLIAAALIAKDPGRYGFDSIVALEPLVFDEVRVTDATGLDVLARLADTTVRALVELNPHFVRGVTPPKREAIVRIPAGLGPLVAQRWAELPANERVSFLEHRVAKGETLSGIGQRYGIATSLLIAANPGVKPTRLRIGQRLTVPLSSAARRETASGRVPKPVVASAAVSARRVYTVRAGDSLWAISRRYGVGVGDLRKWNDLQDDVLKVGQRLRVGAP
ncbi:MAG: LysM peptidoglycan-binding domain-containing protein [Gemmatimonadota bacterium]|nr:LysM peptidoglycan-binding domain-containing protein [Gemmatimonadota bacterium]